MEITHATQTQTDVGSSATMPNTTSRVWVSPDVRQAPAEAPQPTKAAKKRMRKARKAALAKVTDGLKDMKAVPLNGDALAKGKEADEATARRKVVESVNADAAAVAEKWVKYGELCEAEDEAKQKRIVFRENFEGNCALRKRWQNVRDFFVTLPTLPHAVLETMGLYVTGRDGTHYFTLSEWCKGECGVTYEYLRRLDPRYAKLKNQIEGTKPEGSGKPRLSAGDSPSGKTNIDELPEEARAKVLAAINGTPSEAPKETPIEIPDVPPLTMNVRDRVQLAFGFAITCAKLLSPSQKEEFFNTLISMLEDERQPDVQMQETEMQQTEAPVEATA
jgi:hypothetical protein